MSASTAKPGAAGPRACSASVEISLRWIHPATEDEQRLYEMIPLLLTATRYGVQASLLTQRSEVDDWKKAYKRTNPWWPSPRPWMAVRFGYASDPADPARDAGELADRRPGTNRRPSSGSLSPRGHLPRAAA